MRFMDCDRACRLIPLLLIWMAGFLVSTSPSFAAPAPGLAKADKSGFDPDAIHALYLDGDFDQATALLEKAFAEKAVRSHKDSIFAYKHLGVMNAASDDTREKGKYYMVQLLRLEPTAKILDMYASDMIYMIYKNIKEEFEENRRRLQTAENHVIGNHQEPPSRQDSTAAADSTLVAAKSSPPKVAEPQERAPNESTREKGSFFRGRKVYYWIGGTGAAVAGIVLAAYLSSDKPETKKDVYAVD